MQNLQNKSIYISIHLFPKLFEFTLTNCSFRSGRGLIQDATASQKKMKSCTMPPGLTAIMLHIPRNAESFSSLSRMFRSDMHLHSRFVCFVCFFFERVKRSFDDSKRKEMNRKLVAETVKADELVIRYLNENEKRMRIKKKRNWKNYSSV